MITPLLRPQIEPLPDSMRHLPIDPERGYPVPWFVPWVDGKPEFRMAEGAKVATALNQYRCWVCGRRHEPRTVTYLVGPMCGINRVSAEPPSHLLCARYSARNCPFLSKPQMVRRDRETIVAKGSCPGVMIERNPGVSLLWTVCGSAAEGTAVIQPIGDGKGGLLFRLPEPTSLEFFAEGRSATSAEILHSVETGIPILSQGLENDPVGRQQLRQMYERFLELLERFGPPPPTAAAVVVQEGK